MQKKAGFNIKIGWFSLYIEHSTQSPQKLIKMNQISISILIFSSIIILKCSPGKPITLNLQEFQKTLIKS